MSVSLDPEEPIQASGDRVWGSRADAFEDDCRYGSFAFAGLLLMVVCLITVPEGAAAVTESGSYVKDTHYIFASLMTLPWGRVLVFMGVAQLLIGAGVCVESRFARWAGLIVLGLSAIAQLLLIPAYPSRSPYLYWSLMVLALDVLAVFALTACGKPVSSAAGGRRFLRRSSIRGAISFGSRKPHESGIDASHPTDPAADDTGEPQSPQWLAWRQSAQKVTRAWNEWLAADGPDRREFAHRYISALAEEERAAAVVERTINRSGQTGEAVERAADIGLIDSAARPPPRDFYQSG